MNIEDERKAFEAWAAKNGYSIEFYKDSWGYRHDDTEDLWKGWLARARVDVVVPRKMTVDDYGSGSDEQNMDAGDLMHMRGWNDCVDACLPNPPKEDGE